MSGVGETIRSLIQWDELPVEMTKDGEEEQDERTVVVEEDDDDDEEGLADAFVPLSSSKKLQDSGLFFEDFHVPKEFVAMVDHSNFPLLTDAELINTESPHKNIAIVDTLSAVATWCIITRQLQVFDESLGGNPPPHELTKAEKLNRKIGGEF